MTKAIILAVLGTLLASACIGVAAAAPTKKPNPWYTPEVAAEAVWAGGQWRVDLTWVDDEGEMRGEDDVVALPRDAEDQDLWEAAKAVATLQGLPAPKHFRVKRR